MMDLKVESDAAPQPLGVFNLAVLGDFGGRLFIN